MTDTTTFRVSAGAARRLRDTARAFGLPVQDLMETLSYLDSRSSDGLRAMLILTAARAVTEGPGTRAEDWIPNTLVAENLHTYFRHIDEKLRRMGNASPPENQKRLGKLLQELVAQTDPDRDLVTARQEGTTTFGEAQDVGAQIDPELFGEARQAPRDSE